jgi:hypothetical protein
MQTVQVSREPAVGALASYHEAYLVGAGVALLGTICACFVRSSGARAEDDAELDPDATNAPQGGALAVDGRA